MYLIGLALLIGEAQATTCFLYDEYFTWHAYHSVRHKLNVRSKYGNQNLMELHVL